MDFSLVEFKPEDPEDPTEIEVVPTKWIIDSNWCFWPNIDSRKIRSFIIGKRDPEEKWKKYEILKLWGKYATYTEAASKCEKLSVTSDISSAAEGSKRKRVKPALRSPQRLVSVKSKRKKESADSASSEDDDKSDDLFIPSPPKSRPVERNIPTKTSDSSSLCSTPKRFISLASKKSFSRDQVSKTPAKTAAAARSVPLSLGRELIEDSPVLPVRANDTTFEKSVLRSLEVIKLRQRDNENTLHSILSFLNSESISHPAGKVNDTTIKLDIPFRVLDCFTEFDSTDLKDEAVKTSLIKHLRGEGGTNVEDTTRNMLRRVMKDELASLFNWAGRGEKLAFKDTRTCQIIIDAVFQYYEKRGKSTKHSKIKKVIKSWLKMAPHRGKGKRTTGVIVSAAAGPAHPSSEISDASDHGSSSDISF